MRRGFTLVEVVVAIVLLELCVLGVAGLLALSARTLTRAESLESAVASAEGVLDSLRGASVVAADGHALDGGVLEWTVHPDGGLRIEASGDDGASWFVLHTLHR